MLMNLRAIEGRAESIESFELMKTRFRDQAEARHDQPIGWQGGSTRLTAYWLREQGIWAILEASPPESKRQHHRFWNCFGNGEPIRSRMLHITVEINPPHQGADRRVAGIFAKDKAGRLFIAHTGKVGGGRKGISQANFLRFIPEANWTEITTSAGIRNAVAFGPFDHPDFLAQVAAFVRNVAEFKKQKAG